MVAQAAPNAGDIPIRLDGREFTMKPTLEACLAINRLGSGLNAVIQKCANMDFETICEIVCIGLDATSGKNRQEVQQLVFNTGVIHVAADAIMFVRTVANGGVVPKDEDEGEAGDESGGPLADQSASGSSTSSS